MQRRLFKIIYWLGVLSILFLVTTIIVVVIRGFFTAFQPLPEGPINFWNGLFGLFASIMAVLLAASVGSYFKNREERNKLKREDKRKQIRPYCVALQKLMDLILAISTIESVSMEQRQQKREKWALEWNNIWREIRPLINDLSFVSDKDCQEHLNRAFGVIHKYGNESTGSLHDVETVFMLAIKKCEGCKEIFADVTDSI